MEVGATNRSSCVHLGRHLVGMHGFIGNFDILVYTGDFLPLASANSFVLGNTPFQYCLASTWFNVFFSNYFSFVISKNDCTVNL